MSNLVLYSHEVSPPCRAVLMVADAIGVTLDIHEINLMNKDHLSEDFVKINPQHTIPTLNDHGFILWDSHAIMCYLVDKYSKDDSLYPKDLQKRATVDKYLHFDSGVLFSHMKDAFKPLLYFGESKVPKQRIEAIAEAFQDLEKCLKDKKWLAGDSYTIADISCVSTVSSASVLRSLDDYPNIKAWLKRCEDELPGYQKLNVPGNKLLHQIILSKLA